MQSYLGGLIFRRKINLLFIHHLLVRAPLLIDINEGTQLRNPIDFEDYFICGLIGTVE